MTPFPLTREQQGLWVEWKLSAQGISYNTCVQATLDGPVDPDRFSHAIATVVARYQLLHGYCTEQDATPAIALSTEPYSMDVLDVSENAAEETPAAKQRALAILNRKRDSAINLGAFPLVRSALVKVSAQRWYFIGVVPHIISDGYSAVFILQAISKIYNDGLNASQVVDDSDHKDWSDYLQWRSEIPEQKHQDARDYWRDALQGAEHLTPISQGNASATDTRGRRRYFALNAEVTKRLGKLAFAQRTSLFSSLAALYAAFLYRRTDQNDILIAHPVDLRPPGFRNAFGFYVNIVPLRVDLSERPSFAELVRRIGATRRASKKHLHLPSLDIITAKRADDPAFDGRLTNVSMGQTVSRFQGLSLEGITSEPLDNDMIHVRDDLSLMYEISETHVGLWFEYRQSQFSEADIDEMVAQMQSLIEAIDSDPEQPLDVIELVSDKEQKALLALAEGPQISPAQRTWNELFQQICQRQGQQTALLHERNGTPVHISYQQLNAAAERLSQSISVTGRTIAVRLARSPEQIVALLAIMRSGNAYVPIDMGQPCQRVAAIIEDCNAAHIICEADAVSELNVEHQMRHLPFDFDAALELSDASSIPATDHDSAAQPEQLAYVIYTSGSTGVPKGVAVSHHAMQQRMAWLQQEFPLDSGERVLCNTSYAFDVSVAEMFWPLASGATLVLSDPKQSRDFRYLRSLIERHMVSTTALVPSALTALLEGPEAQRELSSLQQVLAAGEALPARLAQRFYQVCDANLVNVYGPTEATIYATCKRILPTEQSINIGTPIANTSAYVLSQGLALTPRGAIGELALAGPGLANGYLNNPELTAQRFVNNPYAPGSLYLTGDRVRMLASGEIEYLGRSDDQIKLRGNRIELGDIAAALCAIPEVDDAAVLIKQSDARATLVAYYNTAKGTPLTSQELREALASRLPGYMIPNQFIALDSLPRLPSGKLDKRRLPIEVTAPVQNNRKPSDAIEQAMALAWANALGLPVSQISLDSHFFELGGDSLLLIGLVSELEQQDLFIEVHELFEHPTIASAAPLIRSEQSVVVDQSPVVGTWPALARHRKLFNDGFVKPEHWNRCIVARFDRHLEVDALNVSLSAIIAHHDGLRLSFQDQDGVPQLTHHPVDAVPTELAYLDLTGVSEIQRPAREREFLNALNAGFKLDAAPLFKLALIDTEAQSTVAIVSHHLLIDMRSCQILVEDLFSAYQMAVSHRPVRLPAKTTSVGALSGALHSAIDERWQNHEVPYWVTQLRDADIAIPGDKSHTLANDEHGCEVDQGVLHATVSEATTAVLTRQVAQTQEAGVHELLLSSFAAAYQEWSKQESLTINTCGIGREAIFEQINLNRTVGELNTVYPVAIDLNAEDMLSEVKQRLAAVPANGLHYGMLRYIAGHDALSTAAEPAVFFNYVSRIDNTFIDAMGAKVTVSPPGVATSAPENRACYALYVEGSIQQNCLVLHLGYSGLRFSERCAQQLLDLWQAQLEALQPTLQQDAKRYA